MKTSDGIRRKLYFQGKIFYCGRCHSKYTFHEGCPSDQEDEEQQPLTEQNENREQQDLPEATPENHWNPETPSERNEVEQNDAALGQSTVLRQRRETEANWRVIVRLPAMRLSNNQTRWYRGNRYGRPTRQLLAHKKETLTVIPPDLLKTEDLIQGNPYPHGMGKKGTGTPRVVLKRKRSWEDSNPVTKRGSRHG